MSVSSDYGSLFPMDVLGLQRARVAFGRWVHHLGSDMFIPMDIRETEEFSSNCDF